MNLYSSSVLTALTAFLQLYLLSDGSSSSSSSSRRQGIFHVAKNSTDGVKLCSIGTPHVTFNAEQLLRSFTESTCVPVPLPVLCAWNCFSSGNCSSFNWKNNSQLCELYEDDEDDDDDDPSSEVCAVVEDCFNFQRFGFHGSCSLRESTSNSTNVVPKTTQIPIATGSTAGTFLVQRNVNGSNFFQKRTWDEYARGFGNQDDNFWLGNDRFHQLTVDFNCSIAFNLKMTQRWYTFSYPSVNLTRASDGYRLYMSGSMSGNTSYGFSSQNGTMFSAYDRDNDQTSATHCGRLFGVGWWYINVPSRVAGVNCGVSNLNANDTHFYFFNNNYVQVQSSSIWITCT